MTATAMREETMTGSLSHTEAGGNDLYSRPGDERKPAQEAVQVLHGQTSFALRYSELSRAMCATEMFFGHSASQA